MIVNDLYFDFGEMSWSSEYIESTVKIYLHTDYQYHSGFGGAGTHASALITFNFEFQSYWNSKIKSDQSKGSIGTCNLTSKCQDADHYTTRATINIDAFRLEYDFIVESALVHLWRMQIKVIFFWKIHISKTSENLGFWPTFYITLRPNVDTRIIS